ncbi:unnamed protein product [Pleuronectes platessa]|uniref:Uncharacterized protein n=1 Tax=Pleuronectes platessa TaxID=8262 RepID=A0A9N7YHF3_PLEPL|nr:unnamed protein product [Pleuronectes platessa]
MDSWLQQHSSYIRNCEETGVEDHLLTFTVVSENLSLAVSFSGSKAWSTAAAPQNATIGTQTAMHPPHLRLEAHPLPRARARGKGQSQSQIPGGGGRGYAPSATTHMG